MVPSGDIIRCGPGENAELFQAAVGGLGLLGIFVSLTLRLKKVSSGLLRVEERVASSLDAMFSLFEQHADSADYLIGWIDGFARGGELGRGLIQIAHDVEKDPDSRHTLQAAYQDLPDTILGILPRSKLWLAMKPTVNDAAMRSLNAARFRLGSMRSGRMSLIPHAQFHFFHDFVPDWKRSWQPEGLIEYQVFVPARNARNVFASLVEGSQQERLIPYLVVFKRHRTDAFLLSYGVDGYSLSLDYHVTARNHDPLLKMLSKFTRDIVLPAGGRFYPAKDSVLAANDMVTSFGPTAVERFLHTKRELDPGLVLQSNLYRRLLAPLNR